MSTALDLPAPGTLMRAVTSNTCGGTSNETTLALIEVCQNDLEEHLQTTACDRELPYIPGLHLRILDAPYSLPSPCRSASQSP